MTISNNLRKLLHPKVWEQKCPLPIATAAGMFVASDKLNLTPKSPAIFVASAATIHRYEGNEDAFQQMPASGATGTFGVGACGELRGMGAMGGSFTQTATGGTTTTLVTNKTIVMDLVGRKVRVIAGAGVGYEGAVVSNTLGANAVITVTPASSVAFDATTQFQIYSGSFWFLNAGAASFTVYDFATNAWTARSATGLPAWGTDGQLVSTIGSGMTANAFATGTATSGGAFTLTNAVKNWLANMWVNYQIRIVRGTGKGQIRVISSNNGTVITVSSAWTVQPDATSEYVIEGNDDTFYLIGNNAVAMYKFTVSTNTWAVISPVAARAGAPAGGVSANWIDSVSTWVLGADDAPSALLQSGAVLRQNGRYIFSFRGGATSTLDIYDIAGNTWISAVPYGNQQETFTTGSSNVDVDGKIYIQKDATGRVFQFDVAEWRLLPFSSTLQTQGAVVGGTKMFILPFAEGTTKINFIYTMQHTASTLARCLII